MHGNYTLLLRYHPAGTTCYKTQPWCEILIDAIKIDEHEWDCLSCDITMAAAKTYMAERQREILMHGAFDCPCGPSATGGGIQYDYLVAKPACWKRTVAGGGGPIEGLYLAEYTPCNRNSCCITSYRVAIDQYGAYTIVHTTPTYCPTPLDCADAESSEGCTDGCKYRGDPD